MWTGLASGSQFIVSLGDSVAATKKIIGNSVASDLISYAARIYCRCINKVGAIAIFDYTKTIAHQQIALLAIKIS